MDRIAVLVCLVLGVVHHDGIDEVKLKIRHFQALTRLQECSRLKMVVGACACLVHEILQTNSDLLEPLLHGVGRNRLGHLMDDGQVQMVLQVLADIRGFHLRLDVKAAQMVRIANA